MYLTAAEFFKRSCCVGKTAKPAGLDKVSGKNIAIDMRELADNKRDANICNVRCIGQQKRNGLQLLF